MNSSTAQNLTQQVRKLTNTRNPATLSTILDPKVGKAQVRQMIRSAIQSANLEDEQKVFRVTQQFTAVDYGGSIVPLSGMGTGSSSNTRVGNQITLEELRIKFAAIQGDTTNLLRMVIVQWSSLGSAPTVQNILRDVGFGYSPLSDFVQGYSSFFKVLADHIFNLSNSDIQGVVSYSIKNLRKKVQYQTSADNSQGTNLIYVMFISDSAATPSPVVSFTSSLYYRDD